MEWFKNILRYSKYPLSVIFAGNNAGLIILQIIGIPLAIISTAVTLGEVIGANVFKDSFVNVKLILMITNVNQLLIGLIKYIYLNKILYVMESLIQKWLIN